MEKEQKQITQQSRFRISCCAASNFLPRYECSGVERWPWVGDRADKL